MTHIKGSVTGRPYRIVQIVDGNYAIDAKDDQGLYSPIGGEYDSLADAINAVNKIDLASWLETAERSI